MIDLADERFRHLVIANFEEHKVPEDSSDFDETWTELIVMTWTLNWALLQKNLPKIFSERRRPSETIFRMPPVVRNYFPNAAGRPKLLIEPTGNTE